MNNIKNDHMRGNVIYDQEKNGRRVTGQIYSVKSDSINKTFNFAFTGVRVDV